MKNIFKTKIGKDINKKVNEIIEKMDKKGNFDDPNFVPEIHLEIVDGKIVERKDTKN